MNIILPPHVVEKLHKKSRCEKKQRQSGKEHQLKKMFHFMRINGVIYR
jgi:hypothetical protein